MSTSKQISFPFGKLPIPADGTALALRIQQLLNGPDSIINASSARIHAQSDATKIKELHINASGGSLNLARLREAAKDDNILKDLQAKAKASPSSIIPSEVETLTLTAEPAYLGTAEVDFRLMVRHLGFSWCGFDDGRLAIGGSPEAPLPGFTGELFFASEQEQLANAIIGIIEELNSELPFKLSKMELQLSQSVPNEVKARAHLRASKGFLGATINAAITLKVSRDGIVTISQLDVDCTNPLVTPFINGFIAKTNYQYSSYDLARFILPGTKMSDVTVIVGDRLELRGKLHAE